LLIGSAAYLTPRFWIGRHSGPLLLVPLAACLLLALRPLRFALGLAIVATVNADIQDTSRKVAMRDRSFFGVLRVSVDFPPGMNTLAHGNTIHGMQRRSSVRSMRRVPLMYYFPTGPIGQVFEAYHSTPVVQRVCVIGLGVGSLAAYGMAGDEFTFLEIDPAVERIARNPAYFRYLDDCRARWSVVLGDARLSLCQVPDGSYSLIILDAFSGDAIPLHLLTREALGIYVAKLADGGLIALHISNKYLDLEPAIRELARDAGLVGLDQNEATIPPNDYNQGRMPSHWIVLARQPSDLLPLADRLDWRPLAGPRRTRLWTDDYSDVIGLVRWR
jgi:spermidine synthase